MSRSHYHLALFPGQNVSSAAQVAEDGDVAAATTAHHHPHSAR